MVQSAVVLKVRHNGELMYVWFACQQAKPSRRSRGRLVTPQLWASMLLRNLVLFLLLLLLERVSSGCRFVRLGDSDNLGGVARWSQRAIEEPQKESDNGNYHSEVVFPDVE